MTDTGQGFTGTTLKEGDFRNKNRAKTLGLGFKCAGLFGRGPWGEWG
jgi:hypothetical protein